MSRKKKSKASDAATKPPSPAPEPTTRRGILITPRTGEELGSPESEDVFAILATLEVPLDLFDQQPWVDCLATHALGIPLKATRWPSDNARVPNNLTLGLFMEPNPEDEGFGKVQFRRMNGAVLVASVTDGKDVEERDVEDMLMYLNGLSAELTGLVRQDHVVETEEMVVEKDEEAERGAKLGKARELAKRRLSLEAFRQYSKECAVRKKV